MDRRRYVLSRKRIRAACWVLGALLAVAVVLVGARQLTADDEPRGYCSSDKLSALIRAGDRLDGCEGGWANFMPIEDSTPADR